MPRPLPVTKCFPIMVASSGYSRLKTTLANLVGTTAPIVLIDRQHLAESVTNGNVKTLRAFLLPVTCQIPVGMTWALSQLTFGDMVASIEALVNTMYFKTFTGALQKIEEQLKT
jgi:hypothetical protein